MNLGEVVIVGLVVVAATVAVVLTGSLNGELAGIFGLALGYLGKGGVAQLRNRREGSEL